MVLNCDDLGCLCTMRLVPSHESAICEQIVWGFTEKESASSLELDVGTVRRMKAEVREKAIKHLM